MGRNKHAHVHAHQGGYATLPLRELLQHAPRTLPDAAECVRRLRVEVSRLQCQAAAVALTGGRGTRMKEAAALLKEVDCEGGSAIFRRGTCGGAEGRRNAGGVVGGLAGGDFVCMVGIRTVRGKSV